MLGGKQGGKSYKSIFEDAQYSLGAICTALDGAGFNPSITDPKLQQAAIANIVSSVKTAYRTILQSIEEFESKSDSYLFRREDKNSFIHCAGAITKLTVDHALNGWYALTTKEYSHKVIQHFLEQMSKIVEHLQNIKKNLHKNPKASAATLKFFSDMIVHFRLIKAQLMVAFVNLKAKLIPAADTPDKVNDYLLDIFNDYKCLQIECDYLSAKVKEIDPSNKCFNGHESSLSQCRYGALAEISQAYPINIKTNTLIETINRQKLLTILQNDNVDNNLHNILRLAGNMVSRCLFLDDVHYAWQYLEVYFSKLNDFHRKRSGTFLAVNVDRGEASNKISINRLFEKLMLKIQKPVEFGEFYSYYQILVKLSELPRNYKPAELTAACLEKFKTSFESQRAERCARLSAILGQILAPSNSKAMLLEDPFFSYLLPLDTKPNNKNFIVRLRQELTSHNCKLKFIVERNTIKTQDLLEARITDVETFCLTYSKLMEELKPKPVEANEVAAQLKALHLPQDDEPEAMSSREYVKRNAKPAKEKRRGNPLPQRKPTRKAS